MAFGVLLSITAEAEQEPLERGSAFDRSRMIDTDGALDRAIVAALRRAVDENGMPLPIVQARHVTGDPSALDAMSDEIDPKTALKARPRPFPDADRAAKGDPLAGLRPGFDAKRRKGAPPDALQSWPHEADPRDVEFDPGHTMSPQQPRQGDEAPPFVALNF